jgi:hypothetical protein
VLTVAFPLCEGALVNPEDVPLVRYEVGPCDAVLGVGDGTPVMLLGVGTAVEFAAGNGGWLLAPVDG